MIELWLVDLQRSAAALEALEREAPLLAAADRRRTAAIKDPQRRRERLVAHIALRLALERVAGPSVRGQAHMRRAGAKPRLATGEASFSLSYSTGLALIGIASTGPIGVDLEALRVVRASKWRRQAIMAAAAGLVGGSIAEPDSDGGFLQAWCRLEAYAKAQGEGLARALADLGLRGTAKRPAPTCVTATARALVFSAGLAVSDATLPGGLYGAVALARGAAPPPVRPFPADVTDVRGLLWERGSAL
jgi:4'-phosphopantetheinyl transferase